MFSSSFRRSKHLIIELEDALHISDQFNELALFSVSFFHSFLMNILVLIGKQFRMHSSCTSLKRRQVIAAILCNKRAILRVSIF